MSQMSQCERVFGRFGCVGSRVSEFELFVTAGPRVSKWSMEGSLEPIGEGTENGGALGGARSGDLGDAALEEAALGGTGGALEGRLVRRSCLVEAAESAQEVGLGRRQIPISGEAAVLFELCDLC